MSTIVAFVVAVLVLQSAAAHTPVTGARVSLVPKPQALLNVTVENRYTSPLVEWHIGIGPRREGQGIAGYTGYGSIPPGEGRTVSVTLANPWDGATGALTLVAFEDGFHQGTAEAVQGWRQMREERARDLSYWVRVFGMMPRVSEPDLRRYLAERSVERAGEIVADPSGVRAKLQGVLQRYPAGPDVWNGLDRLRMETQAALKRATREPSEGAGGVVVDAVSSAVISAQEQVTTTAFVTAIENLRRVPIEAVEYELLDAGTNRPSGGRTFDFGVGDPSPAERGRGRIQPGEVREERVGTEASPDAPPTARLRFVLFDDLSFEGSTTARDELFRHRERQADEYAYSVAVVKQIAALPPPEVEAFLVAKRAERARQLQSEGRRIDTHMLEQFLREAKAAPEHFVAGAKRRADSLERQRQRLLRHKTAGGAAKR